jgi:hypothetical protein
MMASLAFSGGECDVSGLVARHAGGVVPTSVGVPGVGPDDVAERFAQAERRVVARAGVVLDGTQYARLACGLLLPLDDLLAVEVEEILAQPWEPVGAELAIVDDGGEELRS